MIIRTKSHFSALAMVAVSAAHLYAQTAEDPLSSLQRRSTQVFEKASPSVVGLRVRVHLPYAAQVSPDGRVEWYLKTGPFHLPEASETKPLTRFDRSGPFQRIAIPRAVVRPRSSVDRYGTGILFDREGHVLTTYQLVKDSTRGSEIAAISPAGEETSARLLAVDPYSNIAVVRSEGLDGEPAEFSSAEIGDHDSLREGSFVFCVARPYGLPNSAYFGMVSGLDRQVGQFRYERYIQTTIPLPPGSYGAPLLTMEGRVAGMMSCTLKQEGWSEVSFAIPVAMVEEIGRELIERGTVFRGYLGVRVVNRDELSAQQRSGVSEDRFPWGAIVRQVLPGTPAMEAGLQPGDVIVALDDSAVNGWEDLVWALNSRRPGQRVSLRVVRGERKLTLSVQLGKLAPEIYQLDRRP